MNYYLPLFSLLAFIVSPSLTFAQGSQTGGGDQCKNEINQHRLRIQNWILLDEAKDLDFSVARIKGIAYDDANATKSYKSSMLSVLAEGKVVVTCYLDPARTHDPEAIKISEREGVSYRAITIGNPASPTTCINYEDLAGVSHIDCNYDLVMNQKALGDPNYVLTHHEFASIAGIEERTDSFTSDFSVSNQLSQYEHWVSVKVLGAKKVVAHGYTCTIKVTKDDLPIGVLEWTQADNSSRYANNNFTREELSSFVVAKNKNLFGKVVGETRIRLTGGVENKNLKNSEHPTPDLCSGNFEIQLVEKESKKDGVNPKGLLAEFSGKGDFEMDHAGNGYRFVGACKYR